MLFRSYIFFDRIINHVVKVGFFSRESSEICFVSFDNSFYFGVHFLFLRIFFFLMIRSAEMADCNEQVAVINKQVHLFNDHGLIVKLLQDATLDSVLLSFESDIAAGDDSRIVHQVKNAVARVFVAALVNNKNLIAVRSRFNAHHTKIAVLGNQCIRIDLPDSAEQIRL